MDENARKIFDEAFATLDRTAHIKVEHRSYHDDPLTQWAAGMPKKPEPVPAPTIGEIEALVDDRISAALANYHEAKSMRPVTREVLKGLVAGIRAEILTEVGQLRADLTIEKAHSGDRGGEVIDLPNPFRSVRRA
jgi:hypothetical protein